MERNEPSTEEIVRDLRRKVEYTIKLYRGEIDAKDMVYSLAADRLESQVREIAELTEKASGKESALQSLYPVMFTNGERIAALTARAEQAENTIGQIEAGAQGAKDSFRWDGGMSASITLNVILEIIKKWRGSEKG